MYRGSKLKWECSYQMDQPNHFNHRYRGNIQAIQLWFPVLSRRKAEQASWSQHHPRPVLWPVWCHFSALFCYLAASALRITILYRIFFLFLICYFFLFLQPLIEFFVTPYGFFISFFHFYVFSTPVTFWKLHQSIFVSFPTKHGLS